jgi:hypothetical protein
MRTVMIKSSDVIQRLNEGIYDPSIFKAVFIFGGPGSGKSYAAGRTTVGHALKYLSYDNVLEYLFKLQGLDISQISPEEITAHDETIRQRAQQLRDKKKALHLEGRLGLLIDGTGADYAKIEGQVLHLRSLGYDCYAILVEVPLEPALKRNTERSRRLTDKTVIRKHDVGLRNFSRFQRLFGRGKCELFYNENPSAEQFEDIWNTIRKIVKTRPDNPLAKNWLEDELKKNGIPSVYPKKKKEKTPALVRAYRESWSDSDSRW